MYNTKLSSSNCTCCSKTERTLDSFIQYFNKFKATFYKPVNKPYISKGLCDNTLNYNLKVFYQNVRGLKTKLVSLRCSFPMFSFYDIIIFTETWLTPDISDNELGFTGFQVIRLDRNHNNSTSLQGGGVLIAIKNTFNFHPVSLTISNVEQVFAMLFINSCHFLVGGVYLPLTPLSLLLNHILPLLNISYLLANRTQ